MVKYTGDDWNFLNVTARVLDANPVPGSSQMIVMIDGQRVTVCRHQWEAVK